MRMLCSECGQPWADHECPLASAGSHQRAGSEAFELKPAVASGESPVRSGAGGELALAIRLERDDSIPAFGAYLRCEEQHAGSHVILLNVQACMAPTAECEDGSTQEMTREDRLRLIVTSIMHEFGHALESHFRLAVNERHIEQACAAWETAYLSSGGGGAEPVGDTRDKRHEGEPLNDEICGESRAKKL